jgi:hypothetical protein
MAVGTAANDTMIRRLNDELDEKATFANGLVERANAANRDLTDEERATLVETRGRMESLQAQLTDIQDITRVAYETRNRAREVQQSVDHIKGKPTARPATT